MNISLDFLNNKEILEEEKEMQTKVIDALYEDYLAFVKEEKDFWVEMYMEDLKAMPQYAKMKPKMLKFTATKVWRGINGKNVRKIFPLDFVFNCYETVEYNEETKEVVVQRRPEEGTVDE